jgi:hypothetical protein
MRRAEAFLAAAGWRSAAAADAGADVEDVEAALSMARGGRAALWVSEKSELRKPLRRILVLHAGTRGDRAGIDAADHAAVATGAQVTVLHVPSVVPSRTSASLPYRISDHASYDWEEWREEFLRRFCRCSAGVELALRVGAASAAGLRKQIRDDDPDLVVISTSAAGPDPAVAAAIEAVFDVATPVLIVPSVGNDRDGGSVGSALPAAERAATPTASSQRSTSRTNL